MIYTVTSEKIEDTGRGLLVGDKFEEHGLTEKEAARVAERMSREDDGNNVYVSWFRASDGQCGYLNRDGHDTTGERW